MHNRILLPNLFEMLVLLSDWGFVALFQYEREIYVIICELTSAVYELFLHLFRNQVTKLLTVGSELGS